MEVFIVHHPLGGPSTSTVCVNRLKWESFVTLALEYLTALQDPTQGRGKKIGK